MKFRCFHILTEISVLSIQEFISPILTILIVSNAKIFHLGKDKDNDTFCNLDKIKVNKCVNYLDNG